ncbi:hypothetical protein NPIL_571511 [Nephila pilipes]|uniref:Uncharacterized protein n=1 Tax=Nephila pilipes TaxID=299642 RepID=A0A8X6MRR3_NEPPI|nr:hypothetical protein NPIL_571511 [Nephila pilipes]
MSRKLTVLPSNDRKNERGRKAGFEKIRMKRGMCRTFKTRLSASERRVGMSCNRCAASGENPVLVRICVNGEVGIVENLISDLAWVHKYYFLPRGLPNMTAARGNGVSAYDKPREAWDIIECTQRRFESFRSAERVAVLLRPQCTRFLSLRHSVHVLEKYRFLGCKYINNFLMSFLIVTIVEMILLRNSQFLSIR